MSKVDVSLTLKDWEEVLPEDERSKNSAREFWYKKRNLILDRLHNINLEDVTEKELLLANLEMNTKIYWELRKLNEVKK